LKAAVDSLEVASSWHQGLDKLVPAGTWSYLAETAPVRVVVLSVLLVVGACMVKEELCSLRLVSEALVPAGLCR